MSREILISIGLDFPKENKEKVKELVLKKFKSDGFKFKEFGEDFMTFELWNWELIEEDFEEFKEYCTYIGKSEYECIDECCFIWEKNEN